MVYNVDKVTIYLSILSVLFISIITLLYFRKENFKFNDERHYLFEGKSVLYGLASNVGALFSVTYFFGATFIYSTIYKSWLFILVIAFYFSISKLYDGMLVKIKKTLTEAEFKGVNLNLLLTFLKKKMTPKNFQSLLWVWLIVYAALLIEELAVCRLVLSTLFPKHPEITALIISTICFVLICYLYIGGFKAILRSDFLQIFIIILFLFTLFYFIFKGQTKAMPTFSYSNIIDFSINVSTSNLVSALFFWFLTGVSWFLCSVDFSSRLNFNSSNVSLLNERKKFVRLSLISFFFVAAIGILFGQYLAETNVLSYSFTPSTYTKLTISHFLSEGSRLVILIFFTSIFCMMFTTLDTLFLTILQIGAYQKKKIFHRKNLVKILGGIVLFSCLLGSDSVSAVGIFFASLFLILAFPIIKYIFFENSTWLPKTTSYLKWAMIISTLAFALIFKSIKISFEWHFLIPALTLLSTLLTLPFAREKSKNKRRSIRNGVK